MLKLIQFVATWEEFGRTLEDVVALTYTPMFGEASAVTYLMTLVKPFFTKKTTKNNALSESISSNKTTYASWVRHFDIGIRRAAKLNLK